MQKYKAKREVVEQVTSKLKSASKVGNLAENDKKTDLETEYSKLQANKNNFSRGDFDDYKISDEELKEHEFDFEKSFNYIKRWFSNGEWHYKYPPKYRVKENRTETKNDIAKTTKLITGIKPLNNPTEKEIDEVLVQLSLYAIDGKLKCKALGNNSVYITDRTQEHIKETHNEPRTIAEMKHKAKYIPFVPEILKNGKISEKSSSKEGVIYGVIGQVEYYDEKKKKTVNESVELAINFDKDTRKFVFSFADKGIKKSLFNYKDLNDHFSADPIVDTETVPITICRISEYTKMSSNINKSLTYSGHKLQGRTKLYGMDISIENKKGSYRSGVDSDGHKWKCLMHYDYGYIRGTVGTDGDHVDCISPETKILMADYTEKKAENICIGDELIGISLETKKNVQRKQIKTKVVNISKGVQDMLEITLSNGVTLKTTLGHLHYKFKGNTKDKIWKRADELNIGDKLVMIFNHHDLVETNDYKKGYLFGAYLGDGSINYDDDRQVYCDIRKGVKYSNVIYRVKKYWNDLGIDVPEIKITEPRQTNSLLKDGRKIVSSMKMAELIIRGTNRVNITKEILTDINKDNYEWCRGFIAGIYDTDGCLNCRHEFQISQTKHQEEFMPFVINCLEILGYKGVQRNNEIKINSDFMADNITMELTQLLKPSIEQKRSFIGQSYRFEPIEIIDIKPYRGEFIAIQTDEQTYIANGFVTHNCYIGPAKDSNKVYVIHQNNPVTHKYDEDKCMLCFESADAAKKGYMKQYDRPGFFGSMDILTVEQFKSYVFSKQGKRIHKSFDVVVTDITEKNKSEKIAQVEKSLYAIAQNKPFVIKHIPADKSTKYENITLRIINFDRNKIEKAVHKMALTLDADIKSSSKGEAFNYKSQEQLTDKFVSEFTKKTNSVYQFVIDYFDLPEVRIVSKAESMKYKGKVIYNPETGKPLEKKDWDKFVKELESFLNRNYDGTGEKIVLSAETLGRLLERMSKTQSREKIKNITLDELQKNNKFDWISSSASNMLDSFGDSVSRERAARIQVAMDSAAIRVTRVKDNVRNDIQNIIIDGIKNKETRSQISQKLFEKCVGLNRDFQKIADTEIQNNMNNAYVLEEVYKSKDGEKVYFKRFEILDDNTCSKCKKIKDKIALWSDVALSSERINDEFAEYAIWEGKENGEMPMGCVHPYCRGSWYRYYPDADK